MTNVHQLSFSLSIPSNSLPTPPPDGIPKETLRTNTIAVTSLPKSFFHPLILELLQSHFATYGEINQWVPLPGFSRIMVVYRYEEDAEKAKLGSDPIVLRGGGLDRSEITLRVYRADPNPLITFTHSSSSFTLPSSAYLQPPAPEKNFLISPPGSPPVGWEQIREDPPNATPLADDLMTALRELQLRDREREGAKDGLEVLLDPSAEDGCGVGVYVEDCSVEITVEGDEEMMEDNWVYGETAPARERWRPVPTALPPIRLAA